MAQTQEYSHQAKLKNVCFFSGRLINYVLMKLLVITEMNISEIPYYIYL